MATDRPSGSITREPFAYFDPDSCSWKMCQGSLLEASGESCTTWPRQVTWDLQFAWELPTSGPPTDESESSSSRLLPTPDANYMNDGQTPEAYLERKRRELAKGYNGNGGGTTLAMTSRLLHEGIDPDAWKAQLLPTPVTSDGRGLTDGDSREGGSSLREIEELLPSPTAWLGRRPENATADPERAASRRHEGTRGKRSLELPDALAMLPTPTTQDAANTAGPSQQARNTPPLNAVAPTLLPTPAAADGDGGRLDNAETFESGRRPSGTKATRTLRSAITHKMLPTPTAEDGERGQGADAARQWGPSLRGAVQPDAMLPTPTAGDSKAAGSRNLPGSKAHVGVSLTDAMRTGDSTTPRRGAPTSPPSPDGKPPSADQHPDQLTIEGA